VRRVGWTVILGLVGACGSSTAPKPPFSVTGTVTTQVCNNVPSSCPGQTTCDVFWHAVATDTTTSVSYTVTYVTSVTGDTVTAQGQFTGMYTDMTAWALGTISMRWRVQALSASFDKSGQATVNATACTVT
jgi:hypothetical protein